MKNKIKLQYTNTDAEKSKTDLDWLEEFKDFLQGKLPDGMSIHEEIKLSPTQAYSVIWYLQEHLRVFPDGIEMCCDCNQLYDSYSEGCYYEIEEKFYCGACEDNSEAVYCDCCMTDMWKKDGRTDDGMYYCDKCKIEKQD